MDLQLRPVIIKMKATAVAVATPAATLLEAAGASMTESGAFVTVMDAVAPRS